MDWCQYYVYSVCFPLQNVPMGGAGGSAGGGGAPMLNLDESMTASMMGVASPARAGSAMTSSTVSSGGTTPGGAGIKSRLFNALGINNQQQ